MTVSSETYRFKSPAEVVPLAYRLARGCAQPDLVAIGLAELMMNAIEHGILEFGFATKRELMERGEFSGEVELRLVQEPWRGRSATVSVDRLADLMRYRVSDDGPGFDWRPWLGTNEARMSAPNGRGIALARSLCFGSLNFLVRGNVVEAVALRAPGD